MRTKEKHNPFSSYANLGHPTSPPQYIRQARLMPNILQAVTECHQRFQGQCLSVTTVVVTELIEYQ